MVIYMYIKGLMKAFVARGVTLGPETSVEGHNTLRATNANYARGTIAATEFWPSLSCQLKKN
jgi:hypothetical protein